MIPDLLARELKAVADALSTGSPAPEPLLDPLKRYVSQSGQIRETPGLVFGVVAERYYRQGRNAIVRVTITLESNAGDEENAAKSETHDARFDLVHRLFVIEKDARKAEVNARGQIKVDDWGQIPGQIDPLADATGDRLRSVIVLRGACRVVVPV